MEPERGQSRHGALLEGGLGSREASRPRPARLCLQRLKLWAHCRRVVRLLEQSLKAVDCHPLQAPQGPGIDHCCPGELF